MRNRVVAGNSATGSLKRRFPGVLFLLRQIYAHSLCVWLPYERELVEEIAEGLPLVREFDPAASTAAFISYGQAQMQGYPNPLQDEWKLVENASGIHARLEIPDLTGKHKMLDALAALLLAARLTKEELTRAE